MNRLYTYFIDEFIYYIFINKIFNVIFYYEHVYKYIYIYTFDTHIFVKSVLFPLLGPLILKSALKLYCINFFHIY